MANGIDFGTAVGLIKGLGSPDPAVIESAVSDWLDDHPEATTTVQDGSITKAKLDSNLQGTVDDVADLKSQIEEISQSGIDASGASDGQVPVADGQGSWAWDDHAGGGVSDVQVNGVSVVTDGVANVPVASTLTFGVVKTSSSGGVQVGTGGLLLISPAAENEIKAASGVASIYKPVVPLRQYISVFYGLAKAAGDSTQSASANAVGNYTESAKSAIQEMLGITGIIGNVEGTTASQAYSVGDAFLHGGALYKATASIAANDAIVPGTNCEQTTIIDLMKGE